MKSLDELINELIIREGGYVNDPDDPGGATKYGITIATLSAARGQKQTPQDVRNLGRDEAAEIYRKNYFFKPKINHLPQSIQPSVFDMYVNAGNNAVKILQRVICQFGLSLIVDGAIGPKTIAAAEAVENVAHEYFADAYGIARRNYYYSLADKRSSSRKYANRLDGGKGGWIKRAEEFISPAYQLSDAEHRARVASWG